MPLTESKLWRDYIKPNTLIGFRIELLTKLGVPDCFVIFNNGVPGLVELKVKRRYQPGQLQFQLDYGKYIPCFIFSHFTYSIEVYGYDKKMHEKVKLFWNDDDKVNTKLAFDYMENQAYERLIRSLKAKHTKTPGSGVGTKSPRGRGKTIKPATSQPDA